MQLLFRRPMFLEIITEVKLILLNKLTNETETKHKKSIKQSISKIAQAATAECG